jgi:hypothetical protein
MKYGNKSHTVRLLKSVKGKGKAAVRIERLEAKAPERRRLGGWGISNCECTKRRHETFLRKKNAIWLPGNSIQSLSLNQGRVHCLR